jgi:hypothetical protein
LALVIICCATGTSIEAANLNGVWATNIPNCNKIFVKKRSEILFADNSDLYGSGFIIDRNKIRSKGASCKIKSSTQEGDITHIIATCATEIMHSDTKFDLRQIDKDTIARVYPGLMELDSKYQRCVM